MTDLVWPAHRRFFVEAPLRAGAACRLDGIAHQLTTVLRLAPDATLVLVNGDGFEYLARLDLLTARQATGAIIAARPVATDPRVHLTLFQCTLKQDKFEWVLQKATELGVARIVPVVSARSIVRPAAALHTKYPRWQAILREATEQCGRTRPPDLAGAIEWRELVLPCGVHGFAAWEAAAGAPPLGKAVAAAIERAEMPSLAFALLVGPEGGLTGAEAQALTGAGWQLVTLGRRLLRAETAALTGVTVLMEQCGELA